jgi:2-hydroxymuconate-semialdehyde hydrolase
VPDVLLLHGSGPGTTGAAWAPLIDALGDAYACAAPELPGFGNTPAAPAAEWPRILAPTEPCFVVGNSAGGAVALKLAARLPDLVRGVVAVGSMGHPMDLPQGLDDLWASVPTETSARHLLEILFHAPQPEAAVLGRLEQMRAQPGYPSLFPPPRQRWVDELSLTPEELAGVRCPVLLIHGAEDQVVPPAVSCLPLLRALPDAQAHIFGHCGHASPVERTPEFNHLVLTFLETHR